MTLHALAPTPTPLDRRVLDALPAQRPGVRLEVVAAAMFAPNWRYGTPAGRADRRRADVAEVRRILRGWEHLGHASCRGGWWSRA